jgi:CRISPR-associated endonuclease Csy4
MAMECFMDIALRPDAEYPAHVLLSTLYDKLHRALAPNNTAGIAAYCPEYKTHPASLGTRLRLLESRSSLQALARSDWLGGLRDHVKVGPVNNVPAGTVHRVVRRVQAKSSPERLRRRLMKRHGFDEAQARQRIPDSAAETLNYPFVQLRSRSTGQTFRLFLRVGPDEPEPSPGTFNPYGLSQTATVPWF